MKKYLFALLLCCAIYSSTLASDFPYGDFSLQELAMKSYVKDATAHAVVLQEFGKTFINNSEGITLIHEYHVKIKIFDSKGFDEGDVQIPIYKSDNNSFERVYDVEGITYYTDEEGAVQHTTLDSRKVITENKNKYWNIVKFAMPGLRNGCVIEYKYKLESPYSLHFRNWDFQASIPKINTEYEARIPAIFNFKATLRGPYKLTKNKAEIDRDCFSVNGTKCDCSLLVFGMSDVPAFEKEEHMTSAKNYMSAITFDLNDYLDPYTGIKRNVTQTWADIDRNLKQHDSFGAEMRKSNLFKERIVPVIAGKADELSKAKAVYAYLQKTLRHNNFVGIYTDNGIRKTLETHTGSVADINLALVAALNAAGINADAVLLSTRDHGNINKLYPVTADFNYVVAKANIGDKYYLLDATDPLLPFGLLPEECINDQGRVMSLKQPSYWIDMIASQKRTRTFSMNFTLQEDGKLKGNMTTYYKGYDAYEKRKSIKKFNSVDEYVENMDEKMPKLKILKSAFQNIDSLDAPLVESLDVEFNLYNNLNADRFTFSPYIFNRISTNPFKLEERSYPVDMGAASDTRVILNVSLPSNFVVESQPQNVVLALPNNEGRFLTNFEQHEGGFTFSNIMQLNNAIYSPDEYPYVKELYNKVIQAQKADIVFKKK